MRRAALVLLIICAACSDPRDAVLPMDGNMKTIAPMANKLKDDEQALLAAYVVRMTVPPNRGIPQGVTIRAAIEYQRKVNEAVSTKR